MTIPCPSRRSWCPLNVAFRPWTCFHNHCQVYAEKSSRFSPSNAPWRALADRTTLGASCQSLVDIGLFCVASDIVAPKYVQIKTKPPAKHDLYVDPIIDLFDLDPTRTFRYIVEAYQSVLSNQRTTCSKACSYAALIAGKLRFGRAAKPCAVPNDKLILGICNELVSRPRAHRAPG